MCIEYIPVNLRTPAAHTNWYEYVYSEIDMLWVKHYNVIDKILNLNEKVKNT